MPHKTVFMFFAQPQILKTPSLCLTNRNFKLWCLPKLWIECFFTSPIRKNNISVPHKLIDVLCTSEILYPCASPIEIVNSGISLTYLTLFHQTKPYRTRPRYYVTCTVLCAVCWYSNWPFTSGESGMKSLKTQAPTLSCKFRNKKPKCDTSKVKRHKRVY